jgi:polyisoprenoid-binding protein YceI
MPDSAAPRSHVARASCRRAARRTAYAVRTRTASKTQPVETLTMIRRLSLICCGTLLPVTAHSQWCPARGPEELPAQLSAAAVIAPNDEPGQRMIVSGTITLADSRTPANGVIVYAYQTNDRGIYARDRGATGLASLHGRLRGWLRTGADGRYTLQTIRPGAYPGNVEAQHIHLEVLPPGGVACEIDAVEFSDDPLMTATRRRSRPGYGGNGISTPTRRADGTWLVTRDIRLWDPARADTMQIDTDSSIIAWRGTKFGGRGKHEGTVRLSPGAIVLGGANLLSGTITIPLASIEVTDIPVWEPVPRNRLRNHLLGEDFFDARRFATATLVVQRAVRTAPGLLRLETLLTIRDVTRAISFDARFDSAPEAAVAGTALFRINRHLWGLTYRGSQLGNDLVDDDITFRIRLVARRRRG